MEPSRDTRAEELRTRLRADLWTAVERMRTLSATESVHGFAIAPTPLYEALGVVVGTEERTAIAARKSLARQPGPWSEEQVRCELRWSWPEGWDAIYLPEASDLSGAIAEPYGDGAGLRLVDAICHETLAELDVLGAFGSGPTRRSVVLAVFGAERSTAELLASAIRLNPDDVVERLRKDLERESANSDAMQSLMRELGRGPP